MQFTENVQTKKQLQYHKREKEQKHAELLESSNKIEQAVLQAAKNIVAQQQKLNSEVEVINMPTSLATSDDIKALQRALEQKDTSVQVTTKNGTDELKTALSDILSVMQAIKSKDNKDLLDAISSMDMSEIKVSNLDDLGDFFFSLEQAVEKIKLEVDLSPINKLSEAVSKINDISLDLPGDLMEETEKQLKLANKNLRAIATRPLPVSGGGGGGNAGLVAGVQKDYDYIDIQQTSATVETFVFKTGGVGGSTVQTITITYTSSAKTDLDTVEWS